MALWFLCGVLTGAFAYLCGSLPTGYLLGKLLRGIDIREHGSKSTGATNVLRTIGKGPALATLLIDLLKGFAAVAFAGWLYAFPEIIASAPAGMGDVKPWAMAIAGFLAVVGHSRPVWLGFAGGKSAATGLGVLLAISWPVGVGAAVVFGLTVAASRMVSLGSILAAVSTVLLMVILDQPAAFVALAVGGSAYVVWRHRANVRRLLAGTEPRIGQSGSVE